MKINKNLKSKKRLKKFSKSKLDRVRLYGIYINYKFNEKMSFEDFLSPYNFVQLIKLAKEEIQQKITINLKKKK